MSSEGSDIEMHSALPKKIKKKPPISPSANADDEKREDGQEAKKIATKDMVNQALIDLKSRKGTSLQAIKKYIKEQYKVDIEKLNYIIKRYLKASVEAGTIVQTKGVGASGSFRLAAGKPENKPAKKKKTPNARKGIEKPTSEKTDKPEKVKKTKPTEATETQKPKKNVDISKPSTSVVKNEKVKKDSEKTTQKEVKIKKPKSNKMADGVTKTPAKKKAAMMKRKSIGSIIKPPKMNPKKG